MKKSAEKIKQKSDSIRKQTKNKQTKSLPSSTTAPIEPSTISRHLSAFDTQMQRMELLRRAKLIFVLRYDIISA